MSANITVLQILKDRESFSRYDRMIPASIRDPVTDALLKTYGRYFDEHPDVHEIKFDPFRTMFFGFYFKNLPDDRKEVFTKVLENALTRECPDQLREGFVQKLHEEDLAARVAQMLTKYNDGDEIKIGRELGALLEEMDGLEKKAQVQFVRDDIADLLADDKIPGLTWHLTALNHFLRPLIPGDFGLGAGRPDTGKTTFFSNAATHWAPQLQKLTDIRDRHKIIWFNNEGPGKRIKPRLFQSALGLTIPECRELLQKGQLIDRYREAVIDTHRIEILDIHGWKSWDVEDVISTYKPVVCMFDMIDNIRFQGGTAGTRTDQVLEAMYQEAREWMVKYDCIGLATSQISAEGDGMLYPGQSMLKDSKTGKQGALDFQIMIGKSHDPNMELVRGIHVAKNKLNLPGKPVAPRFTVNFDGSRGRYTDDWLPE